MTDWQNIELRLQVVDVATGGSITYTTPEGILAALAEAGVLKRREYLTVGPMKPIEYSAWTWEESE